MELNRYIDHTLLKPQATTEDIIKVCDEALNHQFFSVCVNPYYVPVVSQQLDGSDVKVCAVVGFPLGANTPEIKSAEANLAVIEGAHEIDMVINIGAMKSGDYDYVEADIQSVVNVVVGRALVKVIIETCLLTDDEKVKACQLAKSAGADFVKTSTGFSTGGATVEDIALMRKVVGPDMGVKASGGIRDRSAAEAMIAAGATRIGAGGSLQIIGAAVTKSDY